MFVEIVKGMFDGSNDGEPGKESSHSILPKRARKGRMKITDADFFFPRCCAW